ncbi:hypothetical protein FKM82_017884 [Ascaphus truei]
MATSQERTGSLIQRGRSQSDPSILNENGSESEDSTEEMAQSPALRSEYLLSGMRTPPARRNSKLATLGRIFKPWKWRKKKSEKLKQTSAALEKKMTARQSRDELIKKGLLEIMEQGRVHLLAADDLKDSSLPSVERTLQALLLAESVDSPLLDRHTARIPSPPLLPMPQLKAASWVNQCVTEMERKSHLETPSLAIMKNSATVGSSHISGHHPIFPALGPKTTKPHGQPFHSRENKASPKRRVDFRTSRTSSMERSKDSLFGHDRDLENRCRSAKESDENKENLIRDSGHHDDMLLYQDEEALNDSIIAGTLPRTCKKELLAVKLRNRPSKRELEDRNIFPQRTDEERQEIRQQIEIKLSKTGRVERELEDRNIFPQRKDEERQEIRQQIEIKLSK